MAQSDDLIQNYAARRPISKEYFRRAKQVLAGGVGHDLRNFVPVPMYITRAQGSRKWDVDGNEYIDFLLGNGGMLLGHADPEVCDAVTRAVANGSHFGNDHPLQIEWAEWINRLVPSAERVRFVNSGTEASLLALRLARAFTHRSRILRFEGHFHGWHDDVVHGFHPPFDANGSLGVPPQVRENLQLIPDGDLNRVADVLSHDEIAAVILEPTGASWGRVPIDVEFLRGLRELTERHGVPLIFDEVVSGFRFSPGGLQALTGVIPDLTCFAKIVAGGLPGGAVAGSAAIMQLFDVTGDAQHDRFGRVVHFGTFNASPPSAAAGITVLRRVSTGQPIEQANRMAELLRRSWDGVLDRLGVAGYVYGDASVFHVYFETNQERISDAPNRLALRTRDAKLLKGMPGQLITQYQRHLRFRGVDIMSSTGGLLSSVHTEQDIAEATAAFEATVSALIDEGLALRMV
ncbi:MAG: Aspartate aminotransferase family protein [Planctomycetaceae bacterium]|nr:Aspartate aminotransferase family protein [Planctomycetaceae bacterium]